MLAKYLAALEQINSRLKEAEVGIPQRPIIAMGELEKEFPELKGLVMRALLDLDPHSVSVADAVNEWFGERYGERLKISLGPGSYPVIIDGEIWKANFPRIYGRCRLFSLRDLGVGKTRTADGCELNILTMVEHLTQAKAAAMSNSDLENFESDYVRVLNVLTSLQSREQTEMMKAAMADYSASLHDLFSGHPNHGNCKWLALQFAEKLMKVRIAELGGTYSTKGHALAGLAATLASHGITIDSKEIAAIQCGAGVRYGEVPVTRDEAANAIRAAMIVAGIVFPPDAFQLG